MSHITAEIGKQRFRTEIRTAGNLIIADEPVSMGGENLGFSPSELLASSLAACTAATLRMYADQKQWPLEKVSIDVTFERDTKANKSTIVRDIRLTGDLDDAQRSRLLAVANACPIHKVLSNPIEINTNLK